MKKAALLVIILTFLSKIVGFVRDIILSYAYGASNISDAYLISYTIPGVIFTFIGTGLATSYIPLLSDVAKKKGSNEANLFTNNLTNLLMVTCTIIILIGYIFTYPLVRMFAAGFDAGTMDTAVIFTRISIFGIYISILIHIFSGYLNSKNNYHIPVLAGIPFNILIALSIYFSVDRNLILLPIGIIIALSFQLLFIMFFVRRRGFQYKFYINIKDESIKRMIKLSLPVIIGVSVNEINLLVDRTIASTLVVGGISALNYANRLNTFIHGIFVMSIATVMYPKISNMATDKDMEGLKKTFTGAITGITLLIMPIMVGSIIFAPYLISLLYGRGAFNLEANNLTATALIYYSIGMLGFGLREVVSRVFYALHDTKTPMVNAALGMVVNIILNIILSSYLGIGGLALATSLAAIFTTILLFISLHKKIGSFGIKKIITSSSTILIFSIVMGILSKLCFNYLTNLLPQNLSLLIAVIAGIGVYLAFGLLVFFGARLFGASLFGASLFGARHRKQNVNKK